MSDLTAAQWQAIEKASTYLPNDAVGFQGRYIALGELRNIIKKSRRSGEQNNLLWALYSDAIKQGGETLGGWSTEDVHTFLCGEYWGWERIDALGAVRQRPKRRSSRLTKAEFSDYIAFVVQRFAEHNIVLELPGDL